MEEKTSDEFGGLQRKHLPLSAIGIVFVMKADLAVFHVDETTVRAGNAVGVSSQVLQYHGGSAKWALNVDDPILVDRTVQATLKCGRSSQHGESTMEFQFTSLPGPLEEVDELSPKHTAQNLRRYEKLLAPCMASFARHPARAIRSDPASGDHAMQVRVVIQFLSPRVKHRQDADFGTQVLGVGGQFSQRLRAARNKIP